MRQFEVEKSQIDQLRKRRDEALRSMISEQTNCQRYDGICAGKLAELQTCHARDEEKLMNELKHWEQKRADIMQVKANTEEVYHKAQAEYTHQLSQIATPQLQQYAEERSLTERAKIYLSQGGKTVSPQNTEKMKEVLVFMDYHGQSPNAVRNFVFGTDFSKPVTIHWDAPANGRQLKQLQPSLPENSRLLKFDKPSLEELRLRSKLGKVFDTQTAKRLARQQIQSQSLRLNNGTFYTFRGHSSHRLGIRPDGREVQHLTTRNRIPAISSTAAPVADRFSKFGATYYSQGGARQIFVCNKHKPSIKLETTRLRQTKKPPAKTIGRRIK